MELRSCMTVGSQDIEASLDAKQCESQILK